METIENNKQKLNDMEAIENNKLIAEFMGGTLSNVPNLINLPQTIGESSLFCVKGSDGLPSGTYKVERLNELKYHTSWDWLMPVVEKIEGFNDYDVEILQYGTRVLKNSIVIITNVADFSFDKKIKH